MSLELPDNTKSKALFNDGMFRAAYGLSIVLLAVIGAYLYFLA